MKTMPKTHCLVGHPLTPENLYLDKSKGRKDKFVCRICRNAYMRKRRADQRINTPDFLSKLDHSQKLRQRFHKTEQWYDDQLTKQGHACAVCKRPEADNGKFHLSVDHDHGCCPNRENCGNCVRGLLCNRCNRALGLLGDDIDILQSMVAYLQSYQTLAASA